MPSDTKSELDELYEVADDYEAATLDDLCKRAGLTWDCACLPSHPWTNSRDDERCGKCGKVRN